MNYRRDKRTVEQFAQDISECTQVERTLMKEYVDWLNSRQEDKSLYSFQNYGVDNSGELIVEDSKVSTKADFILHKKNYPSRRIEIKFCREEKPYFHLKVNQIKSYIKQDVCIVNYMGVNTSNKKFCILTPSVMENLLKTGQKVVFWQKDCIRIPIKDVMWYNV